MHLVNGSSWIVRMPLKLECLSNTFPIPSPNLFLENIKIWLTENLERLLLLHPFRGQGHVFRIRRIAVQQTAHFDVRGARSGFSAGRAPSPEQRVNPPFPRDLVQLPSGVGSFGVVIIHLGDSRDKFVSDCIHKWQTRDAGDLTLKNAFHERFSRTFLRIKNCIGTKKKFFFNFFEIGTKKFQNCFFENSRLRSNPVNVELKNPIEFSKSRSQKKKCGYFTSAAQWVGNFLTLNNGNRWVFFFAPTSFYTSGLVK